MLLCLNYGWLCFAGFDYPEEDGIHVIAAGVTAQDGPQAAVLYEGGHRDLTTRAKEPDEVSGL